MTERRLYILLEGNDDERFFGRIILPLIAHRYRSVRLIKYACLKRARVCKFVRSIRRTGDEYLLVTDIDQAPGVKAKKQMIIERFCVVDPATVVVIIQEIESWYLAGLDAPDAAILGVNLPATTDHVTKEEFNRTIPPQYDSRIAYMLEILSRFSIPSACRRNRSFRYFMDRERLSPAGLAAAGAPGGKEGGTRPDATLYHGEHLPNE